MEILVVNIEVHEPMATEFFLTSIDKLEETINDVDNTEERERVVSWDLERDSIIQSSVDQASE